jgi:hypothetical protein
MHARVRSGHQGHSQADVPLCTLKCTPPAWLVAPRTYVFARAVGWPCSLSATLYCMTLLLPSPRSRPLETCTTRLFTRVHFEDFPLAQYRIV